MRNRRNVRRQNRITELLNNEVFERLVAILFAIIIIFIMILFYRRYTDELLLSKQREELEKQTDDIFTSIEDSTGSKDKKSQEKKDNATLAVVGDILCENDMIDNAKNGDNYNFNPMFQNISKYTKNANIAIGTLETNLTNNDYSGVGKYNSPNEFLQAVKGTGINLVSVAHNHELDYGTEGLNTTVKAIQDNGMSVTGIKNNSENEDKDFTGNIKEVNGIKIAFLAYTYGLSNEEGLTEDDKSNANIYTEEKASKDIEYAKKNSNYIIVIMHWGEINNSGVSEWQDQVTNYLVNNGVDMILGSHPAVVEPMKVVKNSEGKNVLIAYSLGNYISSLKYENADVELILNINLTKKDSEEKAYLQKVDYTPIYVLDNGEKAGNRFELENMKQLAIDYSNGDKSKITREIYNKLISKLDWLENIIKEGTE